MKITVIGTTCIDKITVNRQKRKLFGGITYVITALSVLLKDKGIIFPVTKLEKKYKKEFEKFISPYNNINLKFLYDEQGKTNIIELLYDDKKKSRDEKSFLKSTDIQFKEIEPALSASDILIITFISGYDIKLTTLEKIRKNFKGIIYGDIHSYILEKTDNNIRPFKRINKPEKFLQNFDIIQGSDIEWSVMLKSKFLDLTFDKYKAAATYVLGLGCKKMIITMGDKGVFGAELIHNKIKFYYIKAKKVNNIIDTTGCGDTLLAGTVFKLLKGKKFKASLKFGNSLAAEQTKRVGFFPPI